MSRKRLEIKEGERYGRLTVIREVEPHVNRNGEKKEESFVSAIAMEKR